MSVLFAALAGGCLIAAGRVDSVGLRVACFVGAVVGIQLRLLCNLFDGMVAVEHGLKTKSGEIYNELPDRFADLCIFVGAGYSDPAITWLPELGWAAGAMSILTAYVRALGASAGAGQHFMGPMAKQHRMATMTICCVVSMVAVQVEWRQPVLAWGLGVVAVGCLVTIVRRTFRIVRRLESA